MTPEARIRAAWEKLKASPHDKDAARELCAAINAYHNSYERLREVCERINTRGGEA